MEYILGEAFIPEMGRTVLWEIYVARGGLQGQTFYTESVATFTDKRPAEICFKALQAELPPEEMVSIITARKL